MRSRLCRTVGALLLVCVTASCAYYNTFYLARKYYMKATDGQPYEVDRDGTTQRTNYTKSADYAKKLLGVYPKSKFVDDAWLMWARALVGTDDPLKAVAMLQEFETRFAKSDLRPDAEFFLGLAYRMAHKHELAVASFDEFLAQAPKHPLVPYAFYERSKAFMSLERYREAAESAGQVLERFPRHVIADKALRQRAEARYQQHDWAGARADFHVIGDRALTDDERLRYLLREVDCLESSRDYNAARALLHDARSHVTVPPPLPVMPRVSATASAPGVSPQNQQPVSVVRTPAEERYGRLTLRMGGVELLDGRVEQAVELYRSVFQDYPRSQLSAEAQYRIGYAYETGSDDFERARAEYAKVREQAGQSQFAQQAQSRLDNLDRIDRYRTAAGADSLARKAEGRFLVAEHYLFSLERPDRALEEYRAIYDSASNATVRARALNAEAWLLSRKLDRKSAADSLFWKVVREYPATEGQLAARDFLEAEGQVVPESLIVAPKELSKPLLDTTTPLTQPPGTTARLGAGNEPGLIEPGAAESGPGVPRLGAPANGPNFGTPEQWRSSALPDSLRHVFAFRDSLIRSARSDTSAAGRARVDSLRRAMSHPDTLGRGAVMARIASEGARPAGVVVAPDSARAPRLSAVDTLASTRGAPSGASATSAHTGAASAVMGPKRLVMAPDSTKRLSTAARADTARRMTTAVADSTRRMTTATPDSTRGMPSAVADSSRSAVRTDSTHKSALSPKRVIAAPAVTAPAVAAPVVAAPAESHSKSIVSWDREGPPPPRGPKLSAAQRDSVRRDERARTEAKRDSLKHVAATRDSLKRAAKTAKHESRAKPTPGAAAPDSTRGQNP
jgi:tetratricopeptide (TPR) repeat protein